MIRTELRLLKHDPVPAAVLVGMPLVLMTLLSDAMRSTLASEGYAGAAGSAQTVPGMACVFASFAIAVVGFALFREHGWRTWPRLRAAGLTSRRILAGKLALPAALVAAQHLVLFAFGAVALDLDVTGSYTAVALTAAAFGALVLTAGLAAAATLSTIQQVNAVTNLAAMALGGLGGGFVPVASLPDWIEPLAPLSPIYWAM
jgi:ABC-2 type transport system permease protein